MKIYVAGRFQSYHKIRWVIDQIKEMGYSVTWDWTRTPEFNVYGEHRRDHAATPRELLIDYAEADVQGVREADALILCADDSMAGAWIEMGIALERNMQILVVNPERWTIFLELPQVRQFQRYGELFDYLETVS